MSLTSAISHAVSVGLIGVLCTKSRSRRTRLEFQLRIGSKWNSEHRNRSKRMQKASSIIKQWCSRRCVLIHCVLKKCDILCHCFPGMVGHGGQWFAEKSETQRRCVIHEAHLHWNAKHVEHIIKKKKKHVMNICVFWVVGKRKVYCS